MMVQHDFTTVNSPVWAAEDTLAIECSNLYLYRDCDYNKYNTETLKSLSSSTQSTFTEGGVGVVGEVKVDCGEEAVALSVDNVLFMYYICSTF
jgi:hypothetical protein